MGHEASTPRQPAQPGAWPVSPAATERWTLDAVLAALARSPAVEAVVLIGSAAGQLGPGSDLDLLVVLDDAAPELGVLVTRIDGRLADVVFVRPAALDRVHARLLDVEGSGLAHWLATGRVVHDRTGRTTEGARLVREQAAPPAPPAPADLYGLWFAANFNLLHTRRMLAAADPLYDEAIDVRFLYQLMDLFVGYFRARGVPFRGEKGALRHLAADDPPFLDLFRRCLREPNRTRRVALYGELVRQATAPIGPPWPPASTAATVRDATPERVEAALGFWNGLFEGPRDPGSVGRR